MKRAEVEILCWEERDWECGGARSDKEAVAAAEAMSWWWVAEDEMSDEGGLIYGQIPRVCLKFDCWGTLRS